MALPPLPGTDLQKEEEIEMGQELSLDSGLGVSVESHMGHGG